VNVYRLEQVMRFITAYPQLHDQETWLRVNTPCGTVACLAGWTCLLNGYEPVAADWDAPPRDDGSRELGMVGRTNDPDSSSGVHATARDILGLSDMDAALLFAGSQTLDSLWRRVEILTDGQVTR
jgi:hypothetical protein